MKKIIPFLLIIPLLISSCKTQQVPTVLVENHTDTVTVTVKETVHDTLLQTETDLSLFTALLGCDSGRAVLMEANETLKGRIAHISHQSERVNNMLKLQFACKCDSQSIYLTYKQRDTTINHISAAQIPVKVEVEKPLTWWQLFCIKYGPWAFVILGVEILLLLVWLVSAIVRRSVTL